MWMHLDRRTLSSRDLNYRTVAAVQVKKTEKPALNELPAAAAARGTDGTGGVRDSSSTNRTMWKSM